MRGRAAGGEGTHGHPQEGRRWAAVSEQEAQGESPGPPPSISRGTPQLPLCPPSPVPPAILLITTQNSDFISSPSEPSVGITGAG